MNNTPRQFVRPPLRWGFTLVELMVSIAIVAILSSLTLAGLSVARQRVKADRTELTIRKIHEVIMPHYERFRTRTFPRVRDSLPAGLAEKTGTLIGKRRAMVFEMPDGWADLLDSAWQASPTSTESLSPQPMYTAIGSRLITMVTKKKPDEQKKYRTGPFSDAECLWATVMRAGFADPAIIENFREDEFGDKDRNGAREFIDGWGNPIRFLRWAPAFVSRYQPSGATMSHDAFDPGGRDPLAVATLFPLIFSCGPDGAPAIACRDAEGDFSYPRVAFDPYFATREPTNQSPRWHLVITNAAGTPIFRLGKYDTSPDAAANYPVPFGTPIDGRASDDVHNHAMSR